MAHGGQGGLPGGGSGGGSTDVGSAIGASFANTLNQASAVTGLPPTVLLVILAALLLFAFWFVFAR